MIKIWIAPSAKEVTQREVVRAHREYADYYGEIGLQGLNINAAHELASCASCGAPVWAANHAHRTNCERCKKKVGF